jgi:hypothetical protein
MNGTNINITSPSTDITREYMFFSYSIVIMIFLGLVGHSIALIIFNKPPLKWQSVTLYRVNLSIAVLVLSIVGYMLSLVNSIKQNETHKLNLVLCRLSAALEVSACVVYVLTLTLMMWHAYFMTAYPVTSSSRRVRAAIVGLALAWVSGILLGAFPAWSFDDFVAFEGRVTCQLSWVGRDGVNLYYVHLVVVWIYVPGILTLTAYALTRR